MINLTILFDPKDLQKIVSATNKITNVVYNASKRLPYRMAIAYAELLRRNITTGVMPTYPPYHPKYAEYKTLMVGHLKPWQLFGDVLANITVFRHGKGFMGGIPAGKMDRGGKGWYGTGKPSSIAAYARANEFGQGKTPARPIFRPTFENFKAKDLPRFEKETFNEIKRWWR